MTLIEKSLTDYIKTKHSAEECFGFIDGYKKCQKDMVDKKYTEREVVIMLQDCAINFGIMTKSKDDGTFTTQIDKWVKNKLNKQD